MSEEKKENAKKLSYTVKVLEHTTKIILSGEDKGAHTDLRTNEIFTQQFKNIDVGALARFLNVEAEEEKKK